MKYRILLALVAVILMTVTILNAQDEAEMDDISHLYILSNSSPHITVIDTTTNDIIETSDIEDFTGWTWNDDNNYFDGENLWLGLRDPETDDSEVIALNLDTLEITTRLSLGKENMTLYIGKAATDGILHVGKMGSGEVAVIDTVNFEVLDIWEGVPVNGDVVCDADISVDADGVERFFYPTRDGNTVVSLDAQTGEVLEVAESPEGSRPLMLTTAPDGTVWVQEVATNTNAVYDPVTLEVIDRFLTGGAPIVASFTVDGKYGLIGHNDDTVVKVIDTETYEEVAQVEVGLNPQKLAADTNGDFIYAILTKEAGVAIISTEDWSVVDRIDIGTNPTGIFFWDGQEAETDDAA